MREDIRGLKAAVDAIARDQALRVERRAAMRRSADSIYARLDGRDRDLDRMLAWQNRAGDATVLARWAGTRPSGRVSSPWMLNVVGAEPRARTLPPGRGS